MESLENFVLNVRIGRIMGVRMDFTYVDTIGGQKNNTLKIYNI